MMWYLLAALGGVVLGVVMVWPAIVLPGRTWP
jgi:hypothetical protein